MGVMGCAKCRSAREQQKKTDEMKRDRSKLTFKMEAQPEREPLSQFPQQRTRPSGERGPLGRKRKRKNMERFSQRSVLKGKTRVGEEHVIGPARCSSLEVKPGGAKRKR